MPCIFYIPQLTPTSWLCVQDVTSHGRDAHAAMSISFPVQFNSSIATLPRPWPKYAFGYTVVKDLKYMFENNNSTIKIDSSAIFNV